VEEEQTPLTVPSHPTGHIILGQADILVITDHIKAG